jgi:hypothetical protein
MDKIEAQSDLEPYEEPSVEDVPLKPEETMLLGCKTPHSNVAGPNAPHGCHQIQGQPCRNS